MGLSKLNVFVSGIDDPCSVDPRTWYITIYDCDGKVLEYCGKRYVVLPARCGHLEVEVPPGCYYIKAVWGYTVVRPGVYRANHFTDAGIVTVCCGQHACVKLFNPSAHRCGYIYALAVRDLVAQKLVNPKLLAQLEEVNNEILGQIGRPAKLFEIGDQAEIEKAVKHAANKEVRKK